MDLKLFDVVELENKNRATILSISKENKMFAEILDNKGKKIECREISKDEINEILYKH